MQAELLDTGSLARSIEAVLFVASESLSIKTLAKLTGADEADVTVALQQIDADYASRGIVLREIAGGYRFASAPAARSAVEAYLMPPKTNLSPAALETLAIVAYMQPVTKGDIEGIRGVSADSVLSTLVDRRFLIEAGRKDVAGRPILYKTTADFLEAFGLRSLEELPPIDIDADAPIELAFPIMTQLSTQSEPVGGEPEVGEAKTGPGTVEPGPVRAESVLVASKPEAVEAGSGRVAGEPDAVGAAANHVAVETVQWPADVDADAVAAGDKVDCLDVSAASHTETHAEIAATTARATAVAGVAAEADLPTPLEESETVFVS